MDLQPSPFLRFQEGIKLAAPFNASPTTWSPDDLGMRDISCAVFPFLTNWFM